MINIASQLHGVPRNTPKDRLRRRVKHGSKPGPQRYFDSDEEKVLAHHLVEAAGIGYGKARK